MFCEHIVEINDQKMDVILFMYEWNCSIEIYDNVVRGE